MTTALGIYLLVSVGFSLGFIMCALLRVER